MSEDVKKIAKWCGLEILLIILAIFISPDIFYDAGMWVMLIACILAYPVVSFWLYHKKYKYVWLFLIVLGILSFALSIVNYPTCECAFNIVPLFAPFVFVVPVVVIYSSVIAYKRYVKNEEIDKNAYSFILSFWGLMAIAGILMCFAHGQPIYHHFSGEEMVEDTFH